MSAGRRKILKWCILAALLVYAAGMSVWAHHEAARHVCTGIKVEVADSNQSDSVIKKGIVEELHRYNKRIVGTPLHELNTADIEKYLSRYNNFESVHCLISSRGQLVVNIVPLIPVMRVFYGGNSYYINKDGKHILSNAEFFSDVPIVTGNFHKNFTPKQLLPLVRYIEQDAVLKDLVSMIEARDAANLILVPRIRGHVINFGDTTRLDEKKQALTLFYRQVMPYKGWEEYDTISVKFRGQVVATRRDKTHLNQPEEFVEDEDLEEATLNDVDETKLPGGANGQAQTDENNKKNETQV